MTVTTLDSGQSVTERPRTAIIAGNGLLPIKVAEALKADGNPPFVLRCVVKPMLRFTIMIIRKFRRSILAC